jgi:hypothetical protein
VTNKDVLPEGARVWVFEPMVSERPISGVVLGWSLDFLPSGEPELHYFVDIDGGQMWVQRYQITGYLHAV